MFHSALCRPVFTAGFEIVFYNPCTIMSVVYRGWAVEGGGDGGRGGTRWVGKTKVGYLCH